MHGAAVFSRTITPEKVINKTPGGAQLNKLNALRKKLKGAIDGSPVALIGIMKEVSEATGLS